MNKDEIVVGGIYEFQKIDSSYDNARAVVIGFFEGHIALAVEWQPPAVSFVHYWLPEMLTKQIGYDATYSPKYQDLKKSYQEAQDAINHAKSLIAFIDQYQYGGQKQILLNWIQNYESLRDAAQHAMNKILTEDSWVLDDRDIWMIEHDE